MKIVSDHDLHLLVREYLAGYSKTLNYEDLNRDYNELNEIRWARDRYEKLAKKLAYMMAVELLERRKNELL